MSKLFLPGWPTEVILVEKWLCQVEKREHGVGDKEDMWGGRRRAWHGRGRGPKKLDVFIKI